MPLNVSHALRALMIVAAWLLVLVHSGQADDLTFTQNGKPLVYSGAVKYENDKFLILAAPDGSWSKVSLSGLTAREKKPAPASLTPQELSQILQGDPSNPLVRVKVTPEVIACLILEAPIPPEREPSVEKVLSQMIAASNRAAVGVRQFAKKHKLTQDQPSGPVTVVMMESSDYFSRHYDQWEQNPGICFLKDCGWYDPTTNQATFVMSEVLGWKGTADNVLVWQQLFHTGLLKRHAPVPLWFVLGVATGFELAGDKLEPNHLKLNSYTYSGLEDPELVDWDKMVSDYEFYASSDDFLFTDFRDQAWALHWYLINKNKTAYLRYWKMMSELSPLDGYSTEKNAADFKKAFGKTPNAYKPLFTKAFKTASAVPPAELEPEDAFWRDRENWGTVKMTWIDEAITTNNVRMDGTLTNSSALRSRSFCVGFDTNWGQTAVWFVDDLGPLKSTELKPKLAAVPAKMPKGEPTAQMGEHSIDRIWIKSALTDSPAAEKWRKGELPAYADKEEPAAEKE